MVKKKWALKRKAPYTGFLVLMVRHMRLRFLGPDRYDAHNELFWGNFPSVLLKTISEVPTYYKGENEHAVGNKTRGSSVKNVRSKVIFCLSSLHRSGND